MAVKVVTPPKVLRVTCSKCGAELEYVSMDARPVVADELRGTHMIDCPVVGCGSNVMVPSPHAGRV